MYSFLILTVSSNLPFEQLIVREIIFQAIDFEQFTVEQLISSNLPDTEGESE